MIKVSDHIRDLKAYVPGRSIEEIQKEYNLEKIYKLASNENPLGASSKAMQAMKEAFSHLNRYPDVAAIELREKLANLNGVKPGNIAIGNGSEGIMAVTLRAFLMSGEEMLSSEKTFIGFQVLAHGREQDYIEIPMIEDEYKFDLGRIKDSITDKTKVIYLCNPNNPTGTIIDDADMENFLSSIPNDKLVLIDEAYFEYANGKENYSDSIKYLERFDNIIILRTFSKIYGIAGIRIGYSISSENIASTIMKVKLPFEPGNIAQAAAIACLDDDEFVKNSIEMNNKGYEFITRGFDNLNLRWIKSYANFVMLNFDSEEHVNRVTENMLRQGVIIRPLKPFGLADCLRITIGTEEENIAMMNALANSL